MQAFHNSQNIKDMYVARVRAHAEADEIKQGYYWKNGKGCSVGCTLHVDYAAHDRYETELGIPRAIARLQDRIFEGLSNEEAKKFPLAFLEAIQPGADLSGVLPRFFIWLLSDEKHGTMQWASEEGKVATRAVVDLYRRQLTGEMITRSEWRAAAYAAAHAAAADADYAADAAAYDAAAADADYAADAAAAYDAAADAADYAADAAAADYAADAADYAADAAAAYDAAAGADAAAAAARQEHFGFERDQLLALLREAK